MSDTFEAIFTSTGGILSSEDAEKFASIMQKYGKWPKCRLRLIEILEATESMQLNACSSAGGWNCLFSWLSDAVSNKELDLSMRIMRLLRSTTATVEKLKKLKDYFNLNSRALSKKFNAAQDDHPYKITKKHDNIEDRKILSEDASACLQADLNKPKQLLTIPNHQSIPEDLDCEEGHHAEEENLSVMECKDVMEFIQSIQLPSIKHLGRIPKKKINLPSEEAITNDCQETTSKETSSEGSLTFSRDNSHEHDREEILLEHLSPPGNKKKPKELVTVPVHIPLDGAHNITIKIGPWPEPKGYEPQMSKRHLVDEISVEKKKRLEHLSLPGNKKKPKELVTVPVHIPLDGAHNITMKIGPWPEPKGMNLYEPAQRKLYYGIGKMTRTELEGAYFDTVNENLILKRTVQNQSKEIKRLEILFSNFNAGQKERFMSTPTLDDIRITDIQSRNKFLMEKVSVLTHQLLQQSRFHAQAHKCFKKKLAHPNTEKIQQAESKKHIKLLENGDSEDITEGSEDEVESYYDTTSKDTSSFESLLSNQTGNTNTFEHLVNNVDNLRWKISLRQSHEEKNLIIASAEGETNALRKTLRMLNEDYDEICSQLNEAQHKHSELQMELVELNSLRKSYKMLEEKLNDVKEERDMLREVNSKLLALNENGEENLVPNMKVNFEIDYNSIIEDPA